MADVAENGENIEAMARHEFGGAYGRHGARALGPHEHRCDDGEIRKMVFVGIAPGELTGVPLKHYRCLKCKPLTDADRARGLREPKG